MSDLFPGFRRERIFANGIEVNAMIGPHREAPALLLLHGYPQTLTILHKVAPRLASRFNVVATDLRGYGDSDKPNGIAWQMTYRENRYLQLIISQNKYPNVSSVNSRHSF